MAHKTIVASDISGQPDAATVGFGLGDTWFEVDLTEDEKKDLEAALARYVQAGRKAGKRARKKYAPETTAHERELIRTWGRENGYDVSERGQISNEVYLAYHEAQRKKSGAKLAPETTAKQRERIRAWARENGYQIGDKGRIPSQVITGYLAAHEDD